jgi:CubicO group peptidase (beta-lactamase class C family)
MLVKDGQAVYERYFGSYDAETTVFIASASKWLAGATLMTQVDEGKLSLDDPVSKYLPYFTGTKGTMTIRQMFSHTSGLPPITSDARCIYNPLIPMGTCVRQIAKMELIGPPGAQFAYGENSMQVAGYICELVSGQRWESLFQEKIAVPLEMSAATFGAGNNPIIGGGARLRLNDYANFLRMILNRGEFKGRRVLSPESVREMQRNLTAGLPVVYAPRGQEAVNYGIGEWIDLLDEQGRALQVSSPGAFGFTPWVDKKRRLLGVFLVQNQAQNVYPTVAMIQQKVREAVDACDCHKSDDQ